MFLRRTTGDTEAYNDTPHGGHVTRARQVAQKPLEQGHDMLRIVTMCRIDNSGFVACHVVGTTRTKGLDIRSIGTWRVLETRTWRAGPCTVGRAD